VQNTNFDNNVVKNICPIKVQGLTPFSAFQAIAVCI